MILIIPSLVIILIQSNGETKTEGRAGAVKEGRRRGREPTVGKKENRKGEEKPRKTTNH